MTTQRVTRDLVIATAALLLLVAASLYLRDAAALGGIPLVLTPFAAAGGATAAMLALLAARLNLDVRLGWLSTALGLYSLVAIPAATAVVLGIGSPAVVDGIRVLADCLVVSSLVVALVAPPLLTGWRAGRALLGVAAAFGGATLLGSTFPSVVQIATHWQPLRLAIGLVWVGTATAMAIRAARRHEWALWYVAGGIALLGAVHSVGIGLASTPVADLDLTFSSLRLAAVTIVVVGTTRLAHNALARLDIDYAAREEELRLAQIRLDRTAERDHELRSGLAGLAGATEVIRAEAPDADVTMLGTAVAAELSRLDDLLQTPVDIRRSRSRPTGYPVAPVLAGLVALRSSSGMDLRLGVEPGLRARGSSETLAQVITNLLGNAAQHAPGSPVEIRAVRESGQVVIRIRDFGPGIAPGREAAVFERGVRGDRSNGSGLGLHICRSLLAAENGTIAIHPCSPTRPGCSVVVRMPASTAQPVSASTMVASTAS